MAEMILVVGSTGRSAARSPGACWRRAGRSGSLSGPARTTNPSLKPAHARHRRPHGAPVAGLACRRVDTVITTAISLGRSIDDTIESVDRDGNRNLMVAAAEAGVRHFVFTSVLGASPDNPNPFMAAKAATEARRSGCRA